ncbi:MAG: hypothetical protein ABR595_03540 [Psychroflexus sp.]
MKYIFLLLLAMSLFACSSDDDDNVQNNQEFLDDVVGRYELTAAYTDVPLDLNHDGKKNTDLFKEATYCNMSTHLESYRCSITDQNFSEIAIKIPFSYYLVETENFSTCLMDTTVFYKINIDQKQEEVSLIPNDWQDEFITEFNAVFVEMYWENEVAHFTIEKEFYNSEGEWEEATLYMEYEKFRDY